MTSLLHLIFIFSLCNFALPSLSMNADEIVLGQVSDGKKLYIYKILVKHSKRKETWLKNEADVDISTDYIRIAVKNQKHLAEIPISDKITFYAYHNKDSSTRTKIGELSKDILLSGYKNFTIVRKQVEKDEL
ncbi:MAG TPA: hypothetical protein VEL47_04965 [Myxococcota bacterium]|nr:hypothetical protein [Myxococcota bacterium]